MKNKRIGVDKANGAVTLQTRDCELIFLVSYLPPSPSASDHRGQRRLLLVRSFGQELTANRMTRLDRPIPLRRSRPTWNSGCGYPTLAEPAIYPRSKQH